MNSKLIKTKLKKEIYSVIATIIIAVISFLPYLHDFNFFKGREGFSGFSSLRVGIWVTSIFLIGITGWVFAFINAKGKGYRFVMLAPLAMMIFQLFVYTLDSRKSSVNDFNVKVALNFVVLLIIVLIYFRNKK